MDFIELSSSSKNTKEVIGNKARNLCIASEIIGSSCVVKGFSIPADMVETQSSRKIALGFNKALKEIGLSYPLLFRSSSNVEDSLLSFAGMFESYICYNFDYVESCIEKMKLAASSDRVRMYCAFKSIDSASVRLSILVQTYLAFEFSGVAFTKHPISSDIDNIYIEYSYNTNDGIESGTIKPIARKINKASIQTDKRFDTLRKHANQLECAFGYPLDIEWGYKDNRFYLLQVRPITVS